MYVLGITERSLNVSVDSNIASHLPSPALSHALELAEEWGIPVFPVRVYPDPESPGKTKKIPYKGGHGHQDALTNAETIAGWWYAHPEAYVGVPMGHVSKMFAVDIDPDGEAWYSENATRLQCGRIHKTSRGRHLLYKFPASFEVRNSVGKLTTGVDIRGEGGFIVWWPASGGSTVGGIEDVAPAPDWLLDMIRQHQEAHKEKPRTEVPAGFIGSGQRNDFLSREAYRQKKLGASHDQILAVLTTINETRCSPPVSQLELENIVRGKAIVQADPQSEAEVLPPITAKKFKWRDPSTIPPRPWLFGKHYMRGMASATAGIGGAGKSTMLLTEAIGASIGRNLITGEAIPVGPLNVWLHNGEDPPDELERRVAAILIHYSIDPELVEERLHVTSGREMPILVAEALSDGGKLFVPREDGVQLREELIAKKIDIFMADPFVTIHRVNENDNGLIDSVMGLIRNIAHQANCAFEVAHHLRKLNGGDVGIDDIRGAGSIVGACRSVRLMAAMTQDEANRYGIEEKDRKAFSWLVNGKANMLPPGHAREWVHAVGVSLDNAADPYEADNIGVLERWLPPESFLDLTPAEYHSIRRTLQEAKQDELRYSSQASGWAGKLIAKVLGKDPNDKGVKSEMYGLIERWKKSGKLKVEAVHLARQGRNIEIVKWADSNIDVE